MADVLHWKNEISAEDFFHVNHLRQRAAPFLPLHSHDYAEIFFVTEGAGIHEINGELQALKRGDLVLIRPFLDTHCIRESDAKLSIVYIAVRASAVRFLEARYFGSHPSFWGGMGRTPKVLTLSLNHQMWMQSATRKLSAARQTQLEIDRFLLDLTEATGEAHVSSGIHGMTGWLKRACDMIEEPQYFAQGSKGFAFLANRSKEHVARELRKYLGKTPTEIVNQARMRYAADKLCHTSRPIIDIAMDCGFESLSHFYKVFRIAYGITPRRYRQLRQTSFSVPDKDGSRETLLRETGADIKGAQEKIKMRQEDPRKGEHNLVPISN